MSTQEEFAKVNNINFKALPEFISQLKITSTYQVKSKYNF